MIKSVNQTAEMCEEVMNHHKGPYQSVNELRYCCLSFNITSTSTHRVTTLTNGDCGTLSHLTD